MDRPTPDARMRRRNVLRRAGAALSAALVLAGLPGCQIVIGVLQMFKGFPQDDADFKVQTKRDLTEKGKKVVVLSTSTGPAQSEHPSLDVDVIAELTRRLRTREINVVDSHQVARWLDDNGGVTEETDLATIGAKFKADYVILIRFAEFGVREPNSTQLYRGHARGAAVVVEVVPGANGRPAGRQIYHRPFDSSYPRLNPVAAEHGPEVFTRTYVTRLSEELARLFVDHRQEETI